MITVDVKLHKAGTGEVVRLGLITISNDGTSKRVDISHYNVERFRAPHFSTVTRSGRVENHRRQDESIWSLVAKALKSVGYGK